MTSSLITRVRPDRARERGTGVPELLAVLLLVSFLSLLTAPVLQRAVGRARVNAAASGLTSSIRQARVLAVKTRVPHRVALIREGGRWATELQRRAAGSFVSVDGRRTRFDADVAVLDGAGLTSLSRVDVSARGVCDTGRVHFGLAHGASSTSLRVDATCTIDRY